LGDLPGANTAAGGLACVAREELTPIPSMPD